MLHSRRLTRWLLAVGLVANPLRAADPLKYLPDGTFLLFALNLRMLFDAPMLNEDAAKPTPGADEVNAAFAEIGLDPSKDLHRVLFALGEPVQARRTILLLEGRFDGEKLRAKLASLVHQKQFNLEQMTLGGLTVFHAPIPQQAMPPSVLPERAYLAFLEPTVLALAADKDALQDAAARLASARKAELKPKVAELIGKMNAKETFSVVVVPPPDSITKGAMMGLTTITGGITVSDGITGEFFLATKNAEAAKELAQSFEQGLTQMKQILPLIAGQQPGFGPKEQTLTRELLGTIKATARENGVSIKSTITKEFVERSARKDQ
jgi:hypothetical protein